MIYAVLSVTKKAMEKYEMVGRKFYIIFAPEKRRSPRKLTSLGAKRKARGETQIEQSRKCIKKNNARTTVGRENGSVSSVF